VDWILQSKSGKARGAAEDLPSNMVSSFKNVGFSSNGPNAPGGFKSLQNTLIAKR